MTILLNVIDRSGNYVFEDNTPPRALRVTVVSKALGAHKAYIERMIVKNSKGPHWISNPKFIRFRVTRGWILPPTHLIFSQNALEVNNPATPSNSQNKSNQNFEIGILLSVVESSGNYVLETPLPSQDKKEDI